jgi:hypothetical protein
MPKFMVFASEVVWYMKEVEAENEDQIREMVFSGDIDFDYGDITDGDNFQITEISEAKHYA